MVVIDDRFHIRQTPNWLINHRVNSALPGYLMIGAHSASDNLANLTVEALQELGSLLATAEDFLKQRLQARQVYIGRYGHSIGYPIHFHIIPIYAWVEDLFWHDERYRLLNSFADGPGETATDGAELTFFVWREFCEREIAPPVSGPSVQEVIGLMRTEWQ